MQQSEREQAIETFNALMANLNALPLGDLVATAVAFILGGITAFFMFRFALYINRAIDRGMQRGRDKIVGKAKDKFHAIFRKEPKS